MNRGLAAALLLCQNKGVGSGWEPWQCGYYGREGLDGCHVSTDGVLGFHCCPSPQSQGFEQLPRPGASHCLSYCWVGGLLLFYALDVG